MIEEYKPSTISYSKKTKVAQTYNKRIKRKRFEIGDLVWKIILQVGSKDKELGKWSPN